MATILVASLSVIYSACGSNLLDSLDYILSIGCKLLKHPEKQSGLLPPSLQEIFVDHRSREKLITQHFIASRGLNAPIDTFVALV